MENEQHLLVPLEEIEKLDESTTAELESLFKLLANRTRLRILHLIISAGEMCVGNLAKECGMQSQAVSNQLKKLSDRGVIESRREGNNIYYRVVNQCTVALLQYSVCQLNCTEADPCQCCKRGPNGQT